MAEPRTAFSRASAKSAADSAGLSPRTVELVRKSWAAVMPISDAAASLFYERLFQLDPSVRPLFKNDMREQKKKLMQTISVAVDGLASVDKLVPVLKQLGARHAGYMVEDRHYDVVGEALLWTLKEGLGDAFTLEVKRAWQEVYGVIARVMKQGAAETAPKAPPMRFTVETPAEPTPQVRSTSRSGAVVVGVSRPALDLPPDSAHPAGRTLVGVAATPSASTVQIVAPGGITQRTIDLVQKSWAQVLPISDAAASLFYERLFELDPSTKPLFKNDMREQKKKLMQTLTVAVDGLTNLPKLIPTLQALGARHAGYMVQERHYDVVGQALLWTLKEGLGNAFNAEVEGAWTAVYGVVADVMKKAAAHQEAQDTRSDLDEETRIKPARPVARTIGEDGVRPVAQTMPPGGGAAPVAAAAVPQAIAYLPAPSNEPRTMVLQFDGQSVPTFQVRVALETPSPYLTQGRDGETPGNSAPKESLAPGAILGTLCLVFSMVASGVAVLASGKTMSTTVLLGLPLATLALTVTAFSFGAMWARSRSSGDSNKSR